MATFNYQAIDSGGKKITGVIQAESAKNARQLLREDKLIIIHIESEKEKQQKNANAISFKKAISALELSMITRQFAILLNSSLSVEQALYALCEQLDEIEQKGILMSVRNEVLSGKSLAAAMSIYPKIFPPVYCSLVHAGEQSGSLARVMTKLADYSDKTRELTSKIMMALLYPMVVTVVAILAIVGLLVYVVPQVVKVFESGKHTLPLITRIMIASSNGVRFYGIYVVIIIAIAVFVFIKSLNNDNNRIKFHKQLMKLPIAGKLLINVDMAKFCNTLSLLLSSGVPILEALIASQNTLKNYALKIAITNSIALVKEGNNLANALAAQKVFPPVVVYLIASGEKSGNLDSLLSQAGIHQELELAHRSQLLTGILEPALIVFMGLVVMLIVIGIMLPILDMNKMVT
jgi:general secretion pathway protein F